MDYQKLLDDISVIMSKLLDEKLDRRFAEFEKRMDEKLDKRFAGSEKRIDEKLFELEIRLDKMMNLKLKPVYEELAELKYENETEHNRLNRDLHEVGRKVERLKNAMKLGCELMAEPETEYEVSVERLKRKYGFADKEI